MDKRDNKRIGQLGESIAAKYLVGKGLSIVEINYGKKWGEIDIVARETAPNGQNSEFSRETGDIIHFVEVKSVSYETRTLLDWAVTHETWRPEELVHAFKLGQIRKAVETWLHEHAWQGRLQIDVVAVRMVPREKYAVVRYIPNVIAE